MPWHVPGIPEPPDVTVEPNSFAPEALVALSRAAARAHASLTIVTLGPMTNLALALSRDPSLPNRVGRVVMMGGCGNGHGNSTPVAEFNVFADPEAASACLQGFPMTQVRPARATRELGAGAPHAAWQHHRSLLRQHHAAIQHLDLPCPHLDFTPAMP